MAKSISITIFPSAAGAEYLTVSDAMHQVLDFVAALENAESNKEVERQIVWRLTDAHTNSPPFTITAEAFSAEPEVSIAGEAARVAGLFADVLQELLEGRSPQWLDDATAAPLKRAFQRNTNGVGRTEVSVEGRDPLNIVPSNTRHAIAALERREIDAEESEKDYSRTEYGAVEVIVLGLTRWNDKPALLVQDRLSKNKLSCVLSADLAESMGPQHSWSEAWADSRLLVSGALHYGSDGSLKRIEASSAEVKPWTDVALADLRNIDIVEGRGVVEHLYLVRGEDRG